MRAISKLPLRSLRFLAHHCRYSGNSGAGPLSWIRLILHLAYSLPLLVSHSLSLYVFILPSRVFLSSNSGCTDTVSPCVPLVEGFDLALAANGFFAKNDLPYLGPRTRYLAWYVPIVDRPFPICKRRNQRRGISSNPLPSRKRSGGNCAERRRRSR